MIRAVPIHNLACFFLCRSQLIGQQQHSLNWTEQIIYPFFYSLPRSQVFKTKIKINERYTRCIHVPAALSAGFSVVSTAAPGAASLAAPPSSILARLALGSSILARTSTVMLQRRILDEVQYQGVLSHLRDQPHCHDVCYFVAATNEPRAGTAWGLPETAC